MVGGEVTRLWNLGKSGDLAAGKVSLLTSSPTTAVGFYTVLLK
jgi:hypothetical protein